MHVAPIVEAHCLRASKKMQVEIVNQETRTTGDGLSVEQEIREHGGYRYPILNKECRMSKCAFVPLRLDASVSVDTILKKQSQ